MAIPELTEEQRVESFATERLKNFKEDSKIEFTKKELAQFCIKEIDFAANIIESTDIKDAEEQFSEEDS